MEFSVILGSIKRAAEALEAGDAKEVAIQAEHLTTLHPRDQRRVLRRARRCARTANPGKAVASCCARRLRGSCRSSSSRCADPLSLGPEPPAAGDSRTRRFTGARRFRYPRRARARRRVPRRGGRLSSEQSRGRAHRLDRRVCAARSTGFSSTRGPTRTPRSPFAMRSRRCGALRGGAPARTPRRARLFDGDRALRRSASQRSRGSARRRTASRSRPCSIGSTRRA